MVRTQLCTRGEHSWPGSWFLPGALCSGSPLVGLPAAAFCWAGIGVFLGRQGNARYSARFGLRVTLDLSVVLVERETETI